MSSEERKAAAMEEATIKLKTAWKMGVGIVGSLWVIAAAWYGVQSKLDTLATGQLTIVQQASETHDWLSHISQKQDDLEVEVSEHERQLSVIMGNQHDAETKAAATSARDKRFENNQ